MFDPYALQQTLQHIFQPILQQFLQYIPINNINIEEFIIFWRHIRIFGFAGFEIALFSVLAFTIIFVRGLNSISIPFEYFKIMFIIVLVGIPLHYALGANTQLNWLLGLSCEPDFDSLDGIFPC